MHDDAFHKQQRLEMGGEGLIIAVVTLKNKERKSFVMVGDDVQQHRKPCRVPTIQSKKFR